MRQFEVRYAFELAEDVTIPSGSELKFEGGSISGAHTLTGQNSRIDAGLTAIFGIDVTIVGTWEITVIYPQWFGAKGDGITDDTQSMAKLLAFADTVEGVTIFIPKGHYICNSALQTNKSVKIEGEGPGVSILDFSSKNDNSTIDLGIIGSRSKLTTSLSTSALAGYNTVSLSDASMISSDDQLAICDDEEGSFFDEDKRIPSAPYYRAYYKQGEFVKVRSISSNTLTLYNNLFASYPTTDRIDIYKLNLISCKVSDLEIISKQTVGEGSSALILQYCKDSVISNVKLSGTNRAHIYLSMCWGVSIYDCKVDYLSPRIGLNYGIMIGNCQDIIVRDCYMRTSRHAISTGGTLGVVDRNIKIEGGIYKGDIDPTNAVATIDNHENIEWFSIENALIEGGMLLGGNHVVANNCVLNTYSTGVNILLKVQPIGDDFLISNNKLFCDDRRALSSAVFIAINYAFCSKASLNGISIYNNKFILTKDAALQINTMFGIYDLGEKSLVDNNVLSIKGNHFYYTNGKALSISRGDSINRTNFAIHIGNSVKEINITDNIIEGAGIRYIPVHNNETILNIESNYISKNNSECIQLFPSDNINKLYQVIIKSNTFTDMYEESSMAAIRCYGLSTVPDLVIVEGNVIKNVCRGIWFYSVSGNQRISTLHIKDNIFIFSSAFAANATYFMLIYRVDSLILDGNRNMTTASVYFDDVTSVKELSISEGGTRPTSPDEKLVGKMFFDTSINKPVWWTGNTSVGDNGWVGADGNAPT